MTAALTSFEDGVKMRIKSIVADLIPEDRWNDIVLSTVRSFEKDDLPKMVKKLLEEEYKKVIATEFAKPEWRETWTNGSTGASEAVKTIIIDSAPLILASLIGGSMQSLVQQLQYTIQQNRGY